MQQLFRSLLAQASFTPEKPAFLLSQRCLTYDLVIRAVANAQKAISKFNLPKDKPVGVFVDDPPAHIICSLALMGLGYTVAALRGDLIDAARTYGIDTLIAEEKAPDIPDVACYRISDSWFVSSVPNKVVCAEWAETRAVRLVFTSGSTGRPKLVAWTCALLSQFISDAILYRIGPAERSICVTGMSGPGFYIAIAHMVCGKTVCFARPPEILQIASLYNAKNLNCTHSQMRGLLEAKKQTRVPVTFDFIALGCGQLNGAQQSEILTAFGGRLSSSYAGTEFGYSAIATGDVLNLRDRLGNCFALIADVEVVDDQQALVPVGNVGNVRVRVKNPSWNYNGNLDLCPEDRKEWVYTGDLALLDESRLLVLIGRNDEVINDGGVSFDPEAMEVYLRKMPDLMDVAAIRMPVSDGAPQPWLVIVAEAPPVLDDINAWIRQNVPGELGTVRFSRLCILPEIPQTKTGKVARQKLRETLMNYA